MTLSMHGTVWERLERRGVVPSRSDELAEFFRQIERGARAYDLGEDSVYLAQELIRLGWSLGEAQQRALALLVLASLVSVRQGSTRLPLGGGAGGSLGQLVASILGAAGIETEVGPIVREIAQLARTMTFDRLIGGSSEYRPLIAADGCIYQHRLYLLETRFCQRLAERLAAGAPTLGDPAPAIAQVRAGAVALSDEQAAAIARAVAQPLTVISGGPGTGKTATVVSLLRVLARLGVTMAEVAVAAPTGKAAQRLATSIRAGLAAVTEPSAPGYDHDAAIAATLPEPRTLHRLLGYLPAVDRFRHHDNSPLPARVVIVDEASMVDLALMERLFRAVASTARLILIGDADQLPSVEAGCVLRDLVLAGEPEGPGGRPPFACRLTRSYRVDEADPAGREILACAREINAGRGGALLATGGSHVRRLEPAELPRFLADWHREQIADRPGFASRRDRVYRRRGGELGERDKVELRALLAVFENSRLLTVTRRLATGADDINRRLHEAALAAGGGEFRGELAAGEPVVVCNNDYERGLFNGDQGVIVRVADGGDRPRLRAVFARGEKLAVFNLDILRHNLELGYAMTVHRSQGSEFDDVALILPARDLPLLSRELIYTAVTRARKRVTVIGDRALIRAGIHRRAERFSGIANRIG